LESKFAFLFERLNVQRKAELVKKTVTPVVVVPLMPLALTEALEKVSATS
jgi:hypothetical protein